MAQLEYFVVAEAALVDVATNKTSIINVMEELVVQHLPSVLMHELVAVSLWRAEAGDTQKDWQTTLRVSIPDGTHHDFPTNFQFPPSGRRHRIIQRISGLPLTQYGELKFELLLNGEHRAWHVVSVLSPVDATIGQQPPISQ